MSKINKWNPLFCSERIDEQINNNSVAIEQLDANINSFATYYTVIGIVDDNTLQVRDINKQVHNIKLAGVKVNQTYDNINNKEKSSGATAKEILNSYLNTNVYLSEQNGSYFVWDKNGTMIQKTLLLNKAANIDQSTIGETYNNGLQLAYNMGQNNNSSNFKTLWNNLTDSSYQNANVSYSDNNLYIRMIQQATGKDDPLSTETALYSKNDFYDTIAYAILYDYENTGEYLSKEDNTAGLNKLASYLVTDNFSKTELAKIKQKIAISLIQIELEKLDKEGTKNNNLEQVKTSRVYLLLKSLQDTFKEKSTYENYDYLDLSLRSIKYKEYDSSGKATEQDENALDVFNALIAEGKEESLILNFIKNGLDYSDLPKDESLVGDGTTTSSTSGNSLNDLLKNGLLSDLKDYLQFNSNNMIEFDLVSNQYYSSINAYIFFNGVKVDEITSIRWAVEETNSPIYSYASYTYDALLKGARIVNGEFTINFTKSSYMTALMEKVNASEVKDANNTDVINNIYRLMTGSETTSLGDDGKKAAVRKIILDGNEKNIQAIAKEYEKKLWGDNTKDIINKYNEPLYDYKPFDIIIPWGDNLFNLANISSTDKEALTIINQVSIIGESQAIQIGPDNIQQRFVFIAKDINNSLITEQQEYLINK